MKKCFWLILGAMISTSLVAQEIANVTPAGPVETPAAAPGTAPTAAQQKPAPGKTKKRPANKKKASRKKAEAELKTVPLIPGPAVVKVSPASRVNVRGQPTLNSEVVAQLTNGQPVTVIEEVHLKNSGPEDPSAWAKIALPEGAHVWVHSAFVDADTKTVSATRLNLRGGPGENYSVLGRIQHGTTINELTTKGHWIEIEPPTGAYAFIAAQYLSQEGLIPAPPVVAAVEPQPIETNTNTPAEPVPPPTTLAEEPAIAAAPTNMPAETEAATRPEQVAANPPMEPMPETPEAPSIDEPPPPRIVQREGIVRGTFSIQAPTEFELVSPDNHLPVDYLYTTSTNLDLSRYKGLHIIVSGEEGLDARWKNTPVITIRRIQVID